MSTRSPANLSGLRRKTRAPAAAGARLLRWRPDSAPDRVAERAAGVAEQVCDPVLEEDDGHDEEDRDAGDQQRVLHKRLALLTLPYVGDHVLAGHEEPEHYITHVFPFPLFARL